MYNTAVGKIWSKTKTNLWQVVLCIWMSNKHVYMKPRTQACFVLHTRYRASLHVHCPDIQWTLAYPATTGPDHGQISEIAGYVNHHANRVYKVSLLALPFPFLSCYPSWVQIIVVFWPLPAKDSRNSGIFGCSNDLVQLVCSVRSMGVK